MGNFTVADAWAKRPKTSGDETLFALLDRRMQDAEPNLAKQAAFFLHLLGDPRTDSAAKPCSELFPLRKTRPPSPTRPPPWPRNSRKLSAKSTGRPK